MVVEKNLKKLRKISLNRLYKLSIKKNVDEISSDEDVILIRSNRTGLIQNNDLKNTCSIDIEKIKSDATTLYCLFADKTKKIDLDAIDRIDRALDKILRCPGPCRFNKKPQTKRYKNGCPKITGSLSEYSEYTWAVFVGMYIRALKDCKSQEEVESLSAEKGLSGIMAKRILNNSVICIDCNTI